MASTVSVARVPPRHLRRRRPFVLLAAAAAMRGALGAGAAALACLLAWSLVPLAAGYRPNLVTSESMRPSIAAGDVVLTRGADAPHVRPGTVVLVRDASRGAHVLHRVRSVEGGWVVTQGDANPTPDASPVALDDVEGVGRIVVPLVGRPALAVAGDPSAALPVALGVLGVGLVVASVRGARDQRARAAATMASATVPRSSSPVTYGGIA